MKNQYLAVINTPTKKDVDRQIQRWQEFASYSMLQVEVINVACLTINEMVLAVTKAMHNSETEQIALESFSVISEEIRESVHFASAIRNTGGRIFVISKAVNQPPLIEISPDTLHFLEASNDFMEAEADDVLFIQSYKDDEVNLKQLVYFLSTIESSIGELDGDISNDLLASDIHRAIILAQLIDYRSKSGVVHH